MVVEAWKVRGEPSGSPSGSNLSSHQITKAVNINFASSPPGSVLPYRIVIEGQLKKFQCYLAVET